jgi:hypothetical protein
MRSKGRAPFFLAFKQNLNPIYWHVYCNTNRNKWNKIEKIIAPQNRGVKNSKNKPPNAIKAGSQTPTKFFVCFLLLLQFKHKL